MGINHPIPPLAQRWLSLDALRGLAVIFMITQHVAYWMVRSGSANDWLILLTGAVGGLAAPFFVTLSGLGVTFLCRRHSTCDRLLVIRGAMIVGFGYLMNFLTPHWFSMGSWYVLHLIGLAMMMAPLLRRLPDGGVLALLAAVLVGTVLIQNSLETPFRLFNNDMAVPKKPGGVWRFIVAEGFFPVFPWLAFFLAGMISGRWLLADRPRRIWQSAVVMIAVMATCSALYTAGIGFTRDPRWIRLFFLKPTFYPALTPITLFLIAISLLFILFFVGLEKRIDLRPTNFLVCLGRASLTFLVVHVAAIREGALYFGIWKRMPTPAALLVVVLMLIFFSVAAVWWRKINFKYGAEWLLRQIAR